MLMSYLSIVFILFLIITTLLYYLLPDRVRWCILLLASSVFYLCAGYDKFLIVIVTSVVIWTASHVISRQYNRMEQEIA